MSKEKGISLSEIGGGRRRNKNCVDGIARALRLAMDNPGRAFVCPGGSSSNPSLAAGVLSRVLNVKLRTKSHEGRVYVYREPQE